MKWHPPTAVARNPARKPFIIPVFLRHQGCPHRCVFCNQKALDLEEAGEFKPADLRPHALAHIAHNRKNHRPVQLAFYGGTFLGMKKERVSAFLSAAAALVREGIADHIRFSTRPDSITERRLDRLIGFPIDTVELGAQSMDDGVLAASGRGHSAADTVRAVQLLKHRGYGVGLQLMVGLPGDTEAGSFSSAEKAAALAPDGIRIYPTVVLEGSLLAQRYARGKYTPWSLGTCVRHVTKLYRFFKKNNIRVLRMGLHASEALTRGNGLVAGPFHPAFGHLVQSQLFLETLVAFLKDKDGISNPLTLRLHPCHVSRMVGHANRNLAYLKARYLLETVRIRPDPACPRNRLFVEEAPLPVPF